MVSGIRRFKSVPQKCCIQTKMYRLYRKLTIYGHFSIESIHFCLDATQQKCIDYMENDYLWSFFYIIYTFLFGYNTTKLHRLYGKNDYLWSFFYIIYTFLFGYNTTKMHRLYGKNDH